MFNKCSLKLALPVTTIFPIGNRSLPCEPRRSESTLLDNATNTAAAVVQHSGKTLFAGSFVAAVTSVCSLGLFGLTFGWNIAKPVYDAYQL